MPDLVIGGIALAPLIVAIVAVATHLKMPKEYAPWLNAALSVAAFGFVVFLSESPEYVTLAGYIINALVIFLSAAGFYTTVKFGVEKARGLR